MQVYKEYLRLFSNDAYSVGGLRHVEAREKMTFSRTYNEVVLGFQVLKRPQEAQMSTQNTKEGSVSTSPISVVWLFLCCSAYR